MKNWSRIAVLGLLVLTQAACYTTRVTSGAGPTATTYDDRQWFTLAGLVPLSGPAGRECPNGFSTVESKLGVVDILINIGLSAAGGIAGGFACGAQTDAGARASCIAGFTSVVPFLLGSRTVSYSCNARGGGEVSAVPGAVPAEPTVASTPAVPADAPVSGPR